MDAPRFDALTRLLGASPSRRALLPALGGLLTTPLLGFVPAGSKKKKKGKKSTLCLDGQTVQASKKKKKAAQEWSDGRCLPRPAARLHAELSGERVWRG